MRVLPKIIRKENVARWRVVRFSSSTTISVSQPPGFFALDEPVAAMHARQLGHLSRDELRSLNAR